MDVRHKRRMKIIQNLYAYSFQKTPNSFLNTDEPSTTKIIDALDQVDAQIKLYAKKFPIGKIGKVDLAILRLAIYELVIYPVEPHKAVINEAIELAKELGGEKSYSFINGVLGKVVLQK